MVFWEDVVSNLQVDIFNCFCYGYRATSNRKSLSGKSGFKNYFMIILWGWGREGNDIQAPQSFNFAVKGDCGILYGNLHFKQISVQDLLFLHVNSSVNSAES